MVIEVDGLVWSLASSGRPVALTYLHIQCQPIWKHEEAAQFLCQLLLWVVRVWMQVLWVVRVWMQGRMDGQNSQTFPHPHSPQNKTLVSIIFVIIFLLSFLISELVLIMTMYSTPLTSLSPISSLSELSLGILRNAEGTKSLKVSCWKR